MNIARRKFFGLGSALVGLFGFGACRNISAQEPEEEDLLTDEEIEKARKRIQSEPMSALRALSRVYFSICDHQRVKVDDLVKEICTHVFNYNEKGPSEFIWCFVIGSINRFSWSDFRIIASYHQAGDHSPREEARYDALRKGLQNILGERSAARLKEIRRRNKLANKDSDENFGMINSVIKKGSKAIEDMLALKKIS